MRAARVTLTHLCATCGESFEPRRSTGRYCKNACRQAAYRNRVAEAPLEERERLFGPIPCEPDEAPRFLWEAALHVPEDALLMAIVAPDVCAAVAA